MPGDPINPYSAPASSAATLERSADIAMTGAARQEGNLLLIPIGSSLPDVCIHTGRRGSGRYVDKTLSWASPWIYLGLVLRLVGVLILYFIFRKRGRLKWYVDDSVAARQKRGTLVCVGLFALMVVLTVIAVVTDFMQLFEVVVLCAVALIIASIVMIPKIRVARIDREYIYLRKVHPDAVAAILAG